MLQLRKGKDGVLTLSCEKRKDGAPFEPIRFALQEVDGTGSCVVVEVNGSGALLAAVAELGAEQVACLRALAECGAEGATNAEWLDASGHSSSTFNR